MSQAIGTANLSIPDRRVLMQPALEKDKIDVISASTNVDSGGPRTTMLRPGTILLKGASDNKWYDDETGGRASAPATISSSEAPDADWQSATITLTIDGVAVVTVTLGAADDTIAELVTALNANAAFRANAIASDSGAADLVKIDAIDPAVHLKVTSSLATAFGADGKEAFPTEADIAVITEYCDQLNPLGTAADARVSAVRAGVFDESNLLWQGAAISATVDDWPDMRRILVQRGSRFE